LNAEQSDLQFYRLDASSTRGCARKAMIEAIDRGYGGLVSVSPAKAFPDPTSHGSVSRNSNMTALSVIGRAFVTDLSLWPHRHQLQRKVEVT
jgi:hypothetical protein